CLADLVEIGKVELQKAELSRGRVAADRIHRSLGARRSAARQHDIGAAHGKDLRSFEADTGIGAGDEKAPPGLHADILGGKSAAHRLSPSPAVRPTAIARPARSSPGGAASDRARAAP